MQNSVHFISIGGSAMHNLAISLQQYGYKVTGSDDDIYEPSRSRLQQRGMLPEETGWFPEKVTADLSAVIVGMHARKDNPELLKAQEVGVPVFSYPEYVYEKSKQKQRVVIAGSHGKTTITSIIIHVLKYHKRDFDYLVGAKPDGFDTMARLSADAPVIIIEGDEYASSPIDSQPKFLHYNPHIALISGIAWDHVNFYPTWEEYVSQFEHLAEAMPKAGILIFDESDDMLDIIGQKERADITKVPYHVHKSTIVDGQTFLITKQKAPVSVRIFGEHNMKNIAGAMTVLDYIGITEDQFYEAIPSFKGNESRLERVSQQGNRMYFRDLAHSPSTVRAATDAMKKQYPESRLLAIVDLHTPNSLNNAFLTQYKGTMDSANVSAVYVDMVALTTRQHDSVVTADIVDAFGRSDLHVLSNPEELKAFIQSQHSKFEIMLTMSSANFGSLDINSLFDVSS